MQRQNAENDKIYMYWLMYLHILLYGAAKQFGT